MQWQRFNMLDEYGNSKHYTISVYEEEIMKKPTPLPGLYIVRAQNGFPSTPDKATFLSRPLNSEVVEFELAYHQKEHPDHSVYVIEVKEVEVRKLN